VEEHLLFSLRLFLVVVVSNRFVQRFLQRVRQEDSPFPKNGQSKRDVGKTCAPHENKRWPPIVTRTANLGNLSSHIARDRRVERNIAPDPGGNSDCQFEWGDIPQKRSQLAISRLRVRQKRTARIRKISRETVVLMPDDTCHGCLRAILNRREKIKRLAVPRREEDNLRYENSLQMGVRKRSLRKRAGG
jgi:hypothetical protein